MLDTVGATSLDALMDKIVPKAILLAEPPRVGGGATEQEALAELKAIASLNKRYKVILVWDMPLQCFRLLSCAIY